MPDPAGPKPHYRGGKKVTGASRESVSSLSRNPEFLCKRAGIT